MIRIFLAALFCFALTQQAMAQLIFENKSNQTLKLATAYYLETDAEQCYHTKGWFTIKPNESLVLIKEKLGHRYYYFYAEKTPSGTKWEGDGSFKYAVQSAEVAFDIKDSDAVATNPTATFQKFIQVDVGDNETYTVSFKD